jgi:hypothetical protein
MVDVPCNGCTICCKSGPIFLQPENGDIASNYQTQIMIHPLTGAPKVALKHKPSGECIYLGDTGCTIHDRAPRICKTFDCRLLYLGFTQAQRREKIRQHPQLRDTFLAGRQRLHTLRTK